MEMESIQGYIDQASDLLDRGNLSDAMNLYSLVISRDPEHWTVRSASESDNRY